jgi:putative ABC transport system permease protein
MDDAIQAQYQSDRQWAQIVTVAAGFALFIAVLGLLGLALLAAQRRTREVSIRKVLGASDASVIALVARRFVGLVALAVVLAIPVAYLGVQEWLQAFAYRVDVGWPPFVGAAALVLLVALITVAAQVGRVTRADPAQVLRSE